MIHEYAIDPQLVAFWSGTEGYEFFMKQFGMETRRMVSRRKKYKKAIITLAEGDSIDVFEGVQ